LGGRLRHEGECWKAPLIVVSRSSPMLQPPWDFPKLQPQGWRFSITLTSDMIKIGNK